jgi:CheY-like chemotaxis protein
MMESCSSDKKKVLVIDDESSIVAYLTTVLEDEGYGTFSANDAEQGLAVVRERLPDLITLDIMMPKRSGIALYQDLKLDSKLRGIPVIIVSAFSQSNHFRPSSFRKMVPDKHIPLPDAYVEKPIDVAAFLETVASLTQSPVPEVATDGENAT